MRDLALQAAGVLAILVAVAHSVTAELRLFANARIEPQRVRRVLRMVCQASAVDWIGIGLLLIAAPSLGSQVARQWVIAVAVVVYGYAAVGNAVATRGRHVGWCLMSGVIALALVGL
ncbi:MAG TPA: hypothetical protein VM910_13270 [Bradyrhizobium sp.]|jgi:hypothetical protein|nr:hypothetical protein [Bradyrhizobium sp.]